MPSIYQHNQDATAEGQKARGYDSAAVYPPTKIRICAIIEWYGYNFSIDTHDKCLVMTHCFDVHVLKVTHALHIRRPKRGHSHLVAAAWKCFLPSG